MTGSLGAAIEKPGEGEKKAGAENAERDDDGIGNVFQMAAHSQLGQGMMGWMVVRTRTGDQNGRLGWRRGLEDPKTNHSRQVLRMSWWGNLGRPCLQGGRL